jgi:hypothetical protein
MLDQTFSRSRRLATNFLPPSATTSLSLFCAPEKDVALASPKGTWLTILIASPTTFWGVHAHDVPYPGITRQVMMLLVRKIFPKWKESLPKEHEALNQCITNRSAEDI